MNNIDKMVEERRKELIDAYCEMPNGEMSLSWTRAARYTLIKEFEARIEMLIELDKEGIVFVEPFLDRRLQSKKKELTAILEQLKENK